MTGPNSSSSSRRNSVGSTSDSGSYSDAHVQFSSSSSEAGESRPSSPSLALAPQESPADKKEQIDTIRLAIQRERDRLRLIPIQRQGLIDSLHFQLGTEIGPQIEEIKKFDIEHEIVDGKLNDEHFRGLLDDGERITGHKAKHVRVNVAVVDIDAYVREKLPKNTTLTDSGFIISADSITNDNTSDKKQSNSPIDGLRTHINETYQARIEKGDTKKTELKVEQSQVLKAVNVLVDFDKKLDAYLAVRDVSPKSLSGIEKLRASTTARKHKIEKAKDLKTKVKNIINEYSKDDADLSLLKQAVSDLIGDAQFDNQRILKNDSYGMTFFGKKRYAYNPDLLGQAIQAVNTDLTNSL